MLLCHGFLVLLCLSPAKSATLGYFQAELKLKEVEPSTEPDATAAASVEGEAVDAPAADVLSGQPDPRERNTESGGTAAGSPARDSPRGRDPFTEPLGRDTLLPEEAEQQSPKPGTDTVMLDDPASDALSPQPTASGTIEEEIIPEQEWSEGQEVMEIEKDKPAEDSGWGLSALRGSFQAINGYFDSLVELAGGRNGVCQYRCRHGSPPLPRPGFQLPEPNGCSSSLVGFQFDLGLPAMTTCCNQLDACYDTCGSSKSRCDSKFRWCLHGICKDTSESLGFSSKVQACDSMADALYNTVWTLGCRPYMNSQRAACVCAEEERDEL